jgi:hypothetical protein
VIVGEYRDTAGDYQPLSATESSDRLTPATEITAVPPDEVHAALYSVSCTVSGQCVAAGRYTDSTDLAPMPEPSRQVWLITNP